MLYLYAQNDIWVNEKLMIKMHSLKRKIRRKSASPTWEKKQTSSLFIYGCSIVSSNYVETRGSLLCGCIGVRMQILDLISTSAY